MQSKTLLSLAALLPAALANFKVFCGMDCNGFDGAGCVPACIFLNNPPSCEDAKNSVVHYLGADVSNCGGVSCDGCVRTENPKDWDITRLEIANQQTCNPSHLYWEGGGDDPHFTIFNGDGGVGIRDTDDKPLGECVIPEDPQRVQCAGVYGNMNFVHQFDCTTDLVYNDSPN